MEHNSDSYKIFVLISITIKYIVYMYIILSYKYPHLLYLYYFGVFVVPCSSGYKILTRIIEKL